ncbi:hypothetical protein UAW_01559 [Enterococcus haemoperoxidus ATCC BAA-382]|uniref:Initiator Rep protein WH1 domain-containing protein n=1 Tax=Enterococcus haemoperoxidus ATCC BAA-382 TaxID=1158608 RepID=R2QKF8_9ENTE|nr:replication initiation protein [Enterococcus haemoperoxidus]EOH97077.1 hypothetical protein UAW_01559 [Enterococcus haemoperoxidus ATCC BAA-382]EOT59890.1 hypothetical protein I583_02525 [Enterococcus haemoperoxidus ATCC BAA-382]OJG56070.1 hypothetical protein RV06_GL000186 [Enterococcus haemoperoxidus]
MNDYVKYKNELNTVSFGAFNANEFNLFFAILSKTKEIEHKQIYLTWDDLKRLANYKSTSTIRFLKDLKSMHQKLIDSEYVHLYTDDEQIGLESFAIFRDIKFLEKEKAIEAQFNPKFTCLLNQVNTNATCFSLEEFISLKKKYSKNLYRLLKQFEQKGNWEVQIETLFFLLGIPKNYQVGQIDQKILKPALEELNKYFDHLFVEKKYSKTQGNKVEGYVFKFDRAKQ